MVNGNNALGESGIVEHFVDHAAILDKVELNISGTRRKRHPVGMGVGKRLRTGGPGRNYGWSKHWNGGIAELPSELRYAASRPWLPRFRIVLHPEGFPLTVATILFNLSRIFRRGFRAQMSYAEIAFDVTG